jgi:glycosyltransferase involved in cell wall biosynthesis
MTSFYSHTLARNDQPFGEIVLRQVIPFMEKMLITISDKSNDGTLQVIRKLEKEFPNKIYLDFENVSSPGELTKERQKQVNRTPEGVWILFLDMDDYWCEDKLKQMVELCARENDSVDAYSVDPYQVIDSHFHDGSWHNRSFTKWFRNKDINYRHPWPRDMIYKGNEMLYWKTNPRVPRLPEKMFFHLSNIKGHSFRTEDWAKQFAPKVGSLVGYPPEVQKQVWQIYEHLQLPK